MVSDGISLTYTCDLVASSLSVYGMTSLHKGYPLGGDYGEPVATLTMTFADGSRQTVTLRNGQEVTTVFGVNMSSRIEPYAENAQRLATFGFDKNFEYYVCNRLMIPIHTTTALRRVTVASANTGYDLLVYGISGD